MFTLNCRGKLLVAKRPLVMGIINVTPDSFYDGSRRNGADAVLQQTERMLNEGADIIDIGAQSTRPNAQLVSMEEELSRLAGIVDVVTDKFPDAFFSIDTFYSKVADICVAAGASIINDISAGQMDGKMIPLAAKLGVPYVCMHMRGTPQTMQYLNQYDDVAKSVIDYFIEKIDECKKAGINDIIVDPGFGFSKDIRQNFELLGKLQLFSMLGRPLMVGLSRKSSIYKTLGVTADEALNGTTVLNTVALMKGAGILRVHDVKEAKECVALLDHLPAFGVSAF
ncbi:MAG: dihydropteroate synthase [Chitinophagaceae bacterium]|nr:dihydropteroate synthase [Chitinophagaceae bacterium]